METSWRESSKIHWQSETPSGNSEGFIGIDKINAGSLMRIADAVENMARNYTELMEEHLSGSGWVLLLLARIEVWVLERIWAGYSIGRANGDEQ